MNKVIRTTYLWGELNEVFWTDDDVDGPELTRDEAGVVAEECPWIT